MVGRGLGYGTLQGWLDRMKSIKVRGKIRLRIWSTVALVVVGITGELLARYVLGLGTPPLSVLHPKIEYMLKPKQDLYRFGNHIVINQYGMRTEPFAAKKEKDEFRIMAFGDSVLNGGNLTDQADLATSLVRDELAKLGYKSVVIGNISAGSWGPGNWLAYAKEYGFFDADVIALLISSHDYVDNPTFRPLDKNTHPTARPVLAIFEGVERYLPRYLPHADARNNATETDRFPAEENEREVQRGLEDLRNFLVLAQEKARTVLVLQHLEKLEIENGTPHPGYQRIKAVCDQLGIIPISLEPYFRRSIESGANPYRDNIHPNEAGQRLIAEAIKANLPSK
jgi:lysophospholipase L1-like esterase